MSSEEINNDVDLNNGSSSTVPSSPTPVVGRENKDESDNQDNNEEKDNIIENNFTGDERGINDKENVDNPKPENTTADNEGSDPATAAVDDILGGLFEEFSDSMKEISHDTASNTKATGETSTSTTPTNSPKKKKKKKQSKGSKKSPKNKKKKIKKRKKKPNDGNDSGIADDEEEEEEERIAGISAKDLEDILMQKIQFRKVLKEEQQQQKRRTSSFFEKFLGKTKTESLEEEKQRQLDELLQNIKDPSLKNEIIGQSQTIDQREGDMTVNAAASNAKSLLKKLLPESLDDVKERRLKELRQHMTDPQLKEQIVAQGHQIMLKEDQDSEIQQRVESLDLHDLIDPKLIRDDDQKREQLTKELRQKQEVKEQMDEQLKMLDPNFDDDDLLQWQLDALSKYHKENDDANGEQKSTPSSSSTLLGLIRQNKTGSSSQSKVATKATPTTDSDSDPDSSDDEDQQTTTQETKEETLEQEMERKKIALKLYLKAIDPDLESLAISNNNTQDLLLLQHRMASKLEEIEENPSKFGFDGRRLIALKSALGERPLLKKMTTMSSMRKGAPLSKGI